VLCYLEGLSTDAAALRLGCPRGTVLSRLSRARESLRGRLTRRGLAARMNLLTSGRSPTAAPLAIPQGLFTSTVRASLTFAEQTAITASHSSTTAVALARGVIHAMTIYKVKLLCAAILMCALIPGGLFAWGALAGGPRVEKEAGEALTPGPGQEDGTPTGVRSVSRLDFGLLHVGAIAEAQLSFEFEGAHDPGLSLKIDVPRFATVKGVRAHRRNGDQRAGVACLVTLALDTKLAGSLAGDLKTRLGDREASVPIAASVAGREVGRPKVLVISSGFGGYSDRPDYYQPWFDLARDAGLDVSYMESHSVPVQSRPGEVAEELTRYDVILLADGGLADLNANSSHMLVQLAESGKRVILTASPAAGDSVLHANRILDPLGMHMDEKDLDIPDVPGQGIPTTEAARLGSDELLNGVRSLSTFRPAPIQIRDPAKAKILAYFPGSRQGFVAVARPGKGEIVAVGMVGLPDWIGERARSTDNARFLKNLLTTKVGR
jgi:Sigma-70, region 4